MHTQHKTHTSIPERLHSLDALRGLALLLNGKRLTRRNLATDPPVGASTSPESAV